MDWKADETVTDSCASFGLCWKNLMTYISVASPCCRIWIYHHGFGFGLHVSELFLVVLSSGGFCLNTPDVHVRPVIDPWWRKGKLLKFARHFPPRVRLMVSSAGPATRTHLVCGLTSSRVHVSVGLNSDTGMQFYYWTSGTNTCESVMRLSDGDVRDGTER